MLELDCDATISVLRGHFELGTSQKIERKLYTKEARKFCEDFKAFYLLLTAVYRDASSTRCVPMLHGRCFRIKLTSVLVSTAVGAVLPDFQMVQPSYVDMGKQILTAKFAPTQCP